MTKPINIIVIGANGRMGSEVCSLARQDARFSLAGAVDTEASLAHLGTLDCLTDSALKPVLGKIKKGVIIDFTKPEISIANAAAAAEHNFPIVIGTTGLNEDQKMELAALATATPILWSANMSIGINVLLRILPALAAALGPQYDMEIMEIHHKHKKDAPSGTALMLGEALAQARDWDISKVRVSKRDGITGERENKQIGIQALRGGDVPGIHNIFFLGPGEFIEVTHHAESRENFAIGALRAAAWLINQPAGPLYSMGDVIWPDSQ